MLNRNFWKGRRVLLTGHTGFKGAWMSLLLEELGVHVSGISLLPLTEPNLYETLSPWPNLTSRICDIRNLQEIGKIIDQVDPELVIHMAAQPLVRESYIRPLETIEINVMGTVNLLESMKKAPHLIAALVVTTDKVYLNNHDIPHCETDPLGGEDPYSGSKAAADILTAAYAFSYFNQIGVSICTARSGNVIGGGDWAKDRIIPDLWRASKSGHPVLLRYPHAVRSWQHVLDPIYGYLLYLEHMASAEEKIPRSLNFGPTITSLQTVVELAEHFCKAFDHFPLYVHGKSDPQFQEKAFLALNASLAKDILGWECLLNIDEALFWTRQWYKAFSEGVDMRQFSKEQITKYLDLVSRNTDNRPPSKFALSEKFEDNV